MSSKFRVLGVPVKSRLWVGICLLALVWGTVAVAQQGSNTSAIDIVSGQIAWINSMVAQKKMSQADADAQITKLKLQLADLVLNSQASSSQAGMHSASASNGTPLRGSPTSGTSESSQGVVNAAGTNATPAARSARATPVSMDTNVASTEQTRPAAVPVGESSPGAASAPHAAGNPVTQENSATSGTSRQVAQGQDAGQAPAAEAEEAAAAGGPACPNPNVDLGLPVPKLGAIEVNTDTIKGSVPSSSDGTVASGMIQLCSNGKPLGTPAKMDGTVGTFSVSLAASKVKLAAGQKITAQYTDNSQKHSDLSSAALVGSCSAAASAGTAPKPPTILLDDNGMASYSGSVPGATSGTVRICVNDLPSNDAGATTVQSNGSFKGGKTFAVKAGDNVTAQTCSSSTCDTVSEKYGPPSAQVPITSTLKAGPADSRKAYVVLIGGVEYGGYSSQAQTTDGFLNIFYGGPRSSNGFSGWGRIRLTNAPQTATNGVVSVISNPTGLATYDYSNVGQVLDYVFGPSWKIPRTKGWDIIAGFGAITPLSSANAPVIFLAPAPGTQNCSTLVSRFSSGMGYSPGLVMAPPGSSTCLAGGYTAIAFTNQDRSNFLMKYGAGVRTSYKFGPNAWGTADATIGQDASVTGGYLRGVVFKVDANIPIPTGSSSWLYLFGSAYMRLQSNQNLPPLILQSPPQSAPVTVPSATVFELPLRQPNRDYYRIGAGLNISQLWCKAFGSGCTASSDSGSGSKSLAVAPSSLSFSGKVGATVDAQAVTVTNNSGDTITNISFAVGGTDRSSFTAGDDPKKPSCKPSVASKGNCTIDVTYTPTKGSQTATLTITDSGGTTSVDLTGTGQ